MTHIALVGFGEAAQSIAQGLVEEGRASVSAYDIRFQDPASAPALLARAGELGVRADTEIAAALADADVVLSLVVGSAAVKAGAAAGPHLKASQIFVDLNSISPDAKIRVGEALAAAGPARFVEGAVMARVPNYRHKVPILLAGSAADRAAGLLNGAGMVCEVVGDEIGQACAVKMIRSVIVKGMEALLLESLTAARKAGVTERILDSISETFPGLDWRHLATYYIGRTHQHGARRVTEMREAAATLEGLGLEAVLSPAIARTIEIAHAKLKASSLPFDSGYADLLSVLVGEAASVEDRTRGAAE